jgi:hypothetical protein
VYRIWDDVDGEVIAKALALEDLRPFVVANRIAQDPENAAKYLAEANMTEGPLKKGLADMLYRWTEKQLRLLADEGGELTLRILKMLKDLGRIQDDPYQRAVKSFEETGQLTDDLADTVKMARKEVMLISSAGMFDIVDDPQAFDRLMEMWRKIHSGAIIQSPNRELAAFRTEFRNLLDSELRRLGWTVDELHIPVGIKQKLLGGPALLMKLEGKLGGKLAKSGLTIRQFQSKIHEILLNPAYTQLGDPSASVGALDAFIGVATGLYMTYDILFNQNLSPEEENLQLGNAWVTALPIVGDFAQGLITGSQGWYAGDDEKVLEAGLWISIGVMG